jgi:uncharacterized protein (DUF1810 family)
VTEADLTRFVNAQAEVYSQVIEEYGCKRTHWMCRWLGAVDNPPCLRLRNIASRGQPFQPCKRVRP